MNKDITIIQGSLHRLRFYKGAEDATDVSLILRNDDTLTTTTFSESYVDGEAVIEIGNAYTETIGVYSYQINEDTPAGVIKYGTGDCDDGDCGWSQIIICEALDEEE